MWILMLIMKLNVAMVLGQLLLTIIESPPGRGLARTLATGGQPRWQRQAGACYAATMAGPAPALCKLILIPLRAEVKVFSYRPPLSANCELEHSLWKWII